MVVLKFGGTSIKSAAMIHRTLAIAERKAPNPCILVYSASNKTTDDLIATADAAADGDAHRSQQCIEKIRKHHRQLCQDLDISKSVIEHLLKDLQQFVHGLILLQEVTKRSKDTLLAFGELLSTTIIHACATAKGLPAYLHDSRNVIKTDSNFGSALPDFEATKKCLEQNIALEASTVHILQGYIGSTQDGVCTTLGRGGSDFTAAICAALLGAHAVEIWTDVPGIMTCDPRIIPHARTLAEISYQEVLELAYFGAKVLHPATIQPAVESSIPVLIKNTKDPEHPGTRITKKHTKTIKAITAKKSLTLLQIHSSRMLNSYGFLHRMFSVFNDFKIPIDIVATSEVSVTVSVEASLPEGIQEELAKLGKLIVLRNQSCLCLVGHKMWPSAPLLAKVFAALGDDVPITLISLGGSENNLTLVVPDATLSPALTRLHQSLFSDPEAADYIATDAFISEDKNTTPHTP